MPSTGLGPARRGPAHPFAAAAVEGIGRIERYAAAMSQTSSGTPAPPPSDPPEGLHVRDAVRSLERMAPTSFAESWDNVGLLVGSEAWSAARILLTIDLTEEVLGEAIGLEAGMIVAYHPPIFAPLTSVTERTEKERIVLRAARLGVAVYSPHTALDNAAGGVNDWLARGIGEGDVRALEPARTLPRSEERKVVTYCPADAVEKVRGALATVGAGRIGDYELCSFEIPGRGTFRGRDGTNPAVGEAGRLEHVDEVRLEMVCPADALGLAVLAIRQVHPYEEPPIEIHELLAQPDRRQGTGRRLVLDRAADVETIADRLRAHLGPDGGARLRVARVPGGPKEHRTIGICAGSGGSLLPTAIAQGCDLFFTGEMKHHEVLAARSAGCAVLLAGHTNTERGYLPILRDRLAEDLDGVRIHVAERDGDPLQRV